MQQSYPEQGHKKSSFKSVGPPGFRRGGPGDPGPLSLELKGEPGEASAFPASAGAAVAERRVGTTQELFIKCQPEVLENLLHYKLGWGGSLKLRS